MAAYFAVAIGVAIDHGHYMSLPFLVLFLCGFGYVGWVSLWQGSVGASVRRAFAQPQRPPRHRRGAAARLPGHQHPAQGGHRRDHPEGRSRAARSPKRPPRRER